MVVGRLSALHFNLKAQLVTSVKGKVQRPVPVPKVEPILRPWFQLMTGLFRDLVLQCHTQGCLGLTLKSHWVAGCP